MDNETKQIKEAEVITQRIMSLGALRAICEKPMYCTVGIGNDSVEIECRRLTPAEQAEIDTIETSVLPPLVVVGDASDPRRDRSKDYYDYQNEDFKRKRMQASREARAMTVYLGCPMFKAEKPNLKDRTDVLNFVEGQLTDIVIQLLYNTIAGAGVSQDGLVNFTSVGSQTS